MFTRCFMRCSGARGRHGGRRAAHALTGLQANEAPQLRRAPLSRHERQRAPTLTRTMDHDAEGAVPLRRASLSDTLASATTVADHTDTASLATACQQTAPSSSSSTSTFIQPSHYEATLSAHHARSTASSWSAAAATDDGASAKASQTHSDAVADLSRQQGVLREAFQHAYTHHNVRLAKDKRVYAREVAAFRQAHGGRSPRPSEVSRHAHATLVPVAALHALSHLDRTRSPLHDTVEQAVVLQEAVTKNNLVQSQDKTLVRCLRCFHVYAARPRTLWGDDVEQSWIDVEREKDKAQRANALMKNPKRRKRLYSVARRTAQHTSDPTACPHCGSRRAQWMMEYVHHSTHMNGAQGPNTGSHD